MRYAGRIGTPPVDIERRSVRRMSRAPRLACLRRTASRDASRRASGCTRAAQLRRAARRARRGTRPARSGLGTAVLRHLLAAADLRGAPAHLVGDHACGTGRSGRGSRGAAPRRRTRPRSSAPSAQVGDDARQQRLRREHPQAPGRPTSSAARRLRGCRSRRRRSARARRRPRGPARRARRCRRRAAGRRGRRAAHRRRPVPSSASPTRGTSTSPLPAPTARGKYSSKRVSKVCRWPERRSRAAARPSRSCSRCSRSSAPRTRAASIVSPGPTATPCRRSAATKSTRWPGNPCSDPILAATSTVPSCPARRRSERAGLS